LTQALFVQATVFFNTNPIPGVIDSFFPSFVTTSGYAFDQPVLIYVDSGILLLVKIDTDGDVAGTGIMTLTGYELDCNSD